VGNGPPSDPKQVAAGHASQTPEDCARLRIDLRQTEQALVPVPACLAELKGVNAMQRDVFTVFGGEGDGENNGG
jgi:hypothetical protein